MDEEGGGFVYHYYDAQPTKPLVEEGVTEAWLVEWSGEPGPARARKVAALMDGDGVMAVEQDGGWEPVTVTAD